MNEQDLFKKETEKKKVEIFLVPLEDAGLKDSYEKLSELMGKYDLAEIVSKKTGLDWKLKTLRVEHSTGEGDFQGLDTALINYARGEWSGISTLAHEMLHLILHQNDWLKDEQLRKFADRHPETNNKKRGDGYLIEQMVAYLLQRDVGVEIDKKEGTKKFLLAFDDAHFELILGREYDSEWLRKLGQKMIEKWDPETKDLMQWIKGVCTEIE